MSELRRDPFTGRWVVIAEGRGARPNEHASRPPATEADPDCPFCEGHEDRTPPESAAIRPPGGRADGAGWTVRAIPNKFPTFGPATERRSSGPGPTFSERRDGTGVHEVILEGPKHSEGLVGLSPAGRRTLVHFLRERVRAIERTPGVASVLLFENWGPESGGTLWHPHAQIVGLPILAPRLAEEERRFAEGDGCRLERSTESEREAGTRIVRDDDRFTVLAPYGSEHPYELRIVPRTHRPSFAAASDEELDRLAELLPELLGALRELLPSVSYNWVVHGAGREVPTSFHWHLEVLPRIVRPDGFELGADLLVNPVAPERAAGELRAVLARPPEEKPSKR